MILNSLRHRMRNVMHRCERWAEKEKLKRGYRKHGLPPEKNSRVYASL